MKHAEQILNGNDIFCTIEFPFNNSTTIKYNITETFSTVNLTEVITSKNTENHKAIVDIDFSVCKKPDFRTIIQHDKKQMTIGLVSLACAFTVVGILVVVIYCNRLLIKVWAYNRYGLRFKQHEDNENDQKPYDVYIAHARDDEFFVVKKLLAGLEEGDSSYKVGFLCIIFNKDPLNVNI